MDHPHELNVTAYGTPVPQGSKTKNRYGAIYDSNPHLGTWREDVKHAALAALEEQRGWDALAYEVIIGRFIFTLPRPKSHYRTGKNAHLLKETAPTLHCRKPDLDKLLRSTWDALTAAGAYTDDSRVAQVIALKAYPSINGPAGVLDRPGVLIHLTGSSA